MKKPARRPIRLNAEAILRHDVASKSLREAVLALEPGAVEVLAFIANRLVGGRGFYGDLDLSKDKRDWMAELAAEMADGAVYAACAVLKTALERSAKRGKKRA